MEEEIIKGSLFGAAFGDAMGAPTEFMPNAEAICARFPPHGPTQPVGNPARVTDDTQMMLAVVRALDAFSRSEHSSLAGALRASFIQWSHDPENNRAPGNTCLTACSALEQDGPWQAATVLGSKGCGANMRVQPIGLLGEHICSEDIAGIAQLQAALTHGHPTALAASDATAMAIRFLALGGEPEQLVEYLIDYAQSQRRIYHGGWLEELWEHTHEHDPILYIERGWRECIFALETLRNALKRPRPELDPCLITGEGWIAEEALATGVHAFLLHWREPEAALQRAAVTSGDSDSIACIAGSLAGAYHGMGTWQGDWIARIEYAEELHDAARTLGKFVP